MDSLSAAYILSLPDNISFEDALIHYRRLLMEHHPDRGGDSERFIQLQQAWTYWSTHRPSSSNTKRGSHDILVHVPISLSEMLFGSEQAKHILFFRETLSGTQVCEYEWDFPPLQPGMRFVEHGLGHEKMDGNLGSLIIICDIQLPPGWHIEQNGTLYYTVRISHREMEFGTRITLPDPVGGHVAIPPQTSHYQAYNFPIQHPEAPTHIQYALTIVPPTQPLKKWQKQILKMTHKLLFLFDK